MKHVQPVRLELKMRTAFNYLGPLSNPAGAEIQVTGTWSDLATNTAPASGVIEIHETSPPPGQACYRAVQP